MAVPTEVARRRNPMQHRSREIVASILAAGREILDREGPDFLTTNRIAERAGVSIGSLYRYFPNKAAIVASIYEADLGEQASDLSNAEWPIEMLSLEEGVSQLVDFQLERHRRLLDLCGDFYRDQHRRYSLARRVGSDEVEARIRAMLVRHGDRVAVRDVDQAAFLVARGISAIVRYTIDERPEKLREPAFRQELIDLLVRYLSGRAPRD